MAVSLVAASKVLGLIQYRTIRILIHASAKSFRGYIITIDCSGIIRDISEQRKLQRDVVAIAEDEQRRIGQGNTTSAIAKQLHLSVHTVDTYREKLNIKLNLANSAELNRYAAQWVLENG